MILEMEYSIQVIYLDSPTIVTSLKKAIKLGFSNNKYTEYQLSPEYTIDNVWDDMLKSTTNPLAILITSSSNDAMRLDELINKSDRTAFFIASYSSSAVLSEMKNGVALYINDVHLPILLMTYLKPFKFTNIFAVYRKDEIFSMNVVEEIVNLHYLASSSRFTQMEFNEESVSIINSMAGSTVVISPSVYGEYQSQLFNELDVDLIIAPDLQPGYKYNGKSTLLACYASANIPHYNTEIKELYKQFGDIVSGTTWSAYSAANLLTRAIKLNQPLSKKLIDEHWCTLAEDLPYYQNNKYDIISNNLLWGVYSLIFYTSPVKLISSFFDTTSPNVQKIFSSVLVAELIYDQDYYINPQTLTTFNHGRKQYQKFTSSSINLKQFTVGRNTRSVVPIIMRDVDNTITDLRVVGDVAFLQTTVIIE